MVQKKKSAKKKAAKKPASKPKSPAKKAPKKAPEKPSKPSGKGKGPRRPLELEELVQLGERFAAIAKKAESKFLNYEAHLRAYQILKSYYDNNKKAAVSSADAKAVGASNFTDGSNYAPVLRKIVEARKYKVAEKERQKAQEELDEAKEEIEELKSKLEKDRDEYEMLSWGLERYRDLQTDPEAIHAIHKAHKTKEGQAELIVVTMYEKEASEEGGEAPKPIPTIATDYLKAAFAYLDKSTDIKKSLDDFAKRIDSIGKPPAK